MVLSYSLALLYGVFQLWLLASPTRTIRFRTAVTGFVCGAVVTFPLAVLLEWSWIRLADRFVSQSRFELVLWASWTVDPFIEEIIRLVPLIVVLAVVVRCRHQWSLTDLVVLGAALGAGYRWGEHLARFPNAPHPVWAESFPDEPGWMLGGLDATKVEPPWVWVFDWIPEGVTTIDSVFAPGLFQIYNTLLVWGTLGGLATGLWVMGSGRETARWLLRSAAVVLVVFAGLSHASVNARGRGGEWPLDLLAVARLVEPWFRAWPLFVLATAIVADLIRTARVKADTTRLRVSDTGEPVALLRLAAQRPLVSLQAVWAFIQIRRRLLNMLASAPTVESTETEAMRAMATALRAQLERDTGLWDHIGSQRTEIRRARLRRVARWPQIMLPVAAVLVALFPGAYFAVGATYRWAAVQNWFADHPNLVLASAIGSAGATAIVAMYTVHRWSTIPETVGELKARLVLGLLCQGFTLAGTGFILYRYQTGSSLNGPLITNVYHGLEAMAALLLVAGLAALILAAGIVVLPAGVLIGITTTELAIGGVLLSATGFALLNYANHGAYTHAISGAVDQIRDVGITESTSATPRPDVDAHVVLAQDRAVGGQWEDGPKPDPPLQAELDDIIEHAWDEHVTRENEFPEIRTEQELQDLMEDVIEHATEWGYRDDGAVYWYDETTNTVVIKNPPGIGGTTYRPRPEGGIGG